VVVTVTLNDEPSGFETGPEAWVEPNKCKLLSNRVLVDVARPSLRSSASR